MFYVFGAIVTLLLNIATVVYLGVMKPSYIDKYSIFYIDDAADALLLGFMGLLTSFIWPLEFFVGGLYLLFSWMKRNAEKNNIRGTNRSR